MTDSGNNAPVFQPDHVSDARPACESLLANLPSVVRTRLCVSVALMMDRAFREQQNSRVDRQGVQSVMEHTVHRIRARPFLHGRINERKHCSVWDNLGKLH